MILQFSVSNFRCLRGLETLNLAASNYDKTLRENVLEDEFPGLKGKHWLKGVGLYGANASGKSTVIEAMRALSSWVRESAKTTDPEEEISAVEPFALGSQAAEEPTAFAIVFVAEGTRYEFRVAATRTLVLHESLRAWPMGKEQVWFERDWNAEAGVHEFSPENPTGLPRSRDIEERTLRNMLYFSKAVAENRKELGPAFRWLVGQLVFLDLGPSGNFNKRFTLKRIDGEDEELKSKIISALRHADIGVVDALAVDAKPPNERVLQLIRRLSPKFVDDLDKGDGTGSRLTQPQLFHLGPGEAQVPLEWERESAGTHRFFALIGPWLEILKKGYTVCIDEIETSMHPLMVRELLRLFFSEKENVGGAQIIFTTHNPLLLDTTLLRRDQVWFTDKDGEGAAHLYPLTDYSPRKGESRIRGYLAGRYGAVPFVPRGLLGSFSALETTESEAKG